jgi:hypothetical protein
MLFPSQELFIRSWAATVNTLKITELDISFKIEKSLKDEPNKCELKIWNLTEDQRSEIEDLVPVTKAVSGLAKKKVRDAARKQATKGIPCKIEAGYDDNMSLLWLGDLRTAKSEREGADWVTTLESGDGEKSYQNARVNVSYGPKTPSDVALRAFVRALGVGEGNVSTYVAKLRAAQKIMPQGGVFSGPAAQHMTDFCKSADLEWSIQDGAVQILDRGAALTKTAIRLTDSTGMLDSPSVDIDGLLKVKTLLIPDVRPGRLLVVDAARVKGNYKIEKATWQGDSASNDWTIEIEAVRY